jgi:predicted DNA-binding transcriptional regulator AlpA
MHSSDPHTFKQLYAQIVASNAKLIIVEGAHQHLFTPPPNDGRKYVVKDNQRPEVYYITHQDGRCECMDLSDARFRVKVSTSVRRFTAEGYAKHQAAMRQQTQHPNHPQRRKKALKNRQADSYVQGHASVRLIKLTQVIAMTGFGKSFIYDCPNFPSAVKWGHSRRAAARWVESEVIAWMQALIDTRQIKTPQMSKPLPTHLSTKLSAPKLMQLSA